MPEPRTARHSVVQASSLHKIEARNQIALFLIALLLVSCSTGRTKLAYTDSSANNWPTQRANPANTGHVASSIINQPYTVLWTVKTGGVAASEPVVRDGLIFFAGLDRRFEVYDLVTGDRRFRKRFDGPVLGVIPGDSTIGVLVDQVERRYFTYDLRTARETGNFKVASVSAPPRSLSDSTIVLGTWHGHVFSYTHDGREIWHTECEGPVMSAPAIVGSVVYVASGRSIFALGARDGSKIWEHGVSGAIEGGPAVGDQVYFGAIDSFATAIKTSDGELAWTTRLAGGVFAAPAIGENLVYFVSNDGTLTALNKRDGTIQWTYNTGAVANHSPTLCGDLLLVTSRQATVSMLLAATGERLWSDSTLSAQAMTSPVVIGDRILLTDSRRLLICLAPASLSPLATPSE